MTGMNAGGGASDKAGSGDGGAPVVTQSSFVTLHYRIVLAQSDEVMVSTFEEKPATLQLGQGQFAEGLENCLLGLRAGERRTFDLAPSQAYGDKQPQLYRPVTKKTLMQHADPDTTFEPGDYVHFPAPNGGQFAGTVVRVDEDSVLFDFNHPLAGVPLRFEVQVIGVM